MRIGSLRTRVLYYHIYFHRIRIWGTAIRYFIHSLPRYQADSNTTGIITLLWNATVPGQGTKTGIDLLRHEGARITEVWSITGDLQLPFMK